MQADGYRLFCKYRNKFGSGFILFIKENIPRKITSSHNYPADEFSICDKSGFFLRHTSPSHKAINFFSMSWSLQWLSLVYLWKCHSNRRFLHDTIEQTDDRLFQYFLIESLMNKPNCSKSATPSFADLIPTNKKSLLMRLESLKVACLIFIKLQQSWFKNLSQKVILKLFLLGTLYCLNKNNLMKS